MRCDRANKLKPASCLPLQPSDVSLRNQELRQHDSTEADSHSLLTPMHNLLRATLTRS